METKQKVAPRVFKESVKLIALLQLSLEQMDVVKTTRFYKQSLKSKLKSLETTVESTIAEPIRSMDNTNEELFNRIQDNIDLILDLDLEELIHVKQIVKDFRENDNR